jgi:hypothetical protein
MVAFLTFLRDFQYVGYFILAAVALRYLYRAGLLQIQLQKTLFGLERTLLERQRNANLGILFLLFVAGGALFGGATLLLPIAERAGTVQAAGIDSAQPTGVPSPTPFIVGGVDIGGCANPQATILAPKPGGTVQGKVDVQIVADINGFAFYTIELGSPDTPDLWMTLFTGNTVLNGKAFTWDSSTMPPGVYHLRLRVVAGTGDSPKPCIVPVQVLSPPIS